MILNDEEIREAQAGQGIRFSQNGVDFVVIRSEVFDKVNTQIDPDHQELRMRLAQSFEENGWDEPGMEAYDTYPLTP